MFLRHWQLCQRRKLKSGRTGERRKCMSVRLCGWSKNGEDCGALKPWTKRHSHYRWILHIRSGPQLPIHWHGLPVCGHAHTLHSLYLVFEIHFPHILIHDAAYALLFPSNDQRRVHTYSYTCASIQNNNISHFFLLKSKAHISSHSPCNALCNSNKTHSFRMRNVFSLSLVSCPLFVFVSGPNK